MRDEMIREIKTVVEEETGAFVTVQDVTKNNGVVLTGMSIREADKSIAPTIYIDNYLAKIACGEITAEKVAEEIVRTYEEHKDDTPVRDGFTPNREYILDRVEFKLVNREMNLQLLRGVPHREFLDLAVVYIVVVESSNSGCASFLLKNGMLESYGITQEEIEDAAAKNTYNAGFEKISMAKIMAQMTGCDMGLSEEDNQMYVISNRTRQNGARAMMFTQMFEDMAEQFDSDIYILPSSIHEVIAIPAIVGMEESYLRDMVREVNATQVSQEERLSNSVYKFSREDKRVSIA